MTRPHNPAEVFPPGEYIEDEIEARGWTEEDLAMRMCDGTDYDYSLCLFIVQMTIEIHEYKGHAPTMGQGMHEKLGKAFGTSAELWRNLETRWIEYCKVKN